MFSLFVLFSCDNMVKSDIHNSTKNNRRELVLVVFNSLELVESARDNGMNQLSLSEAPKAFYFGKPYRREMV